MYILHLTFFSWPNQFFCSGFLISRSSEKEKAESVSRHNFNWSKSAELSVCSNVFVPFPTWAKRFIHVNTQNFKKKKKGGGSRLTREKKIVLNSLKKQKLVESRRGPLSLVLKFYEHQEKTPALLETPSLKRKRGKSPPKISSRVGWRKLCQPHPCRGSHLRALNPRGTFFLNPHLGLGGD